MRILPPIFLLVMALGSALGATIGRAGSLVEFPNQAHRAPSKLLGYLARPDAGLSAMLGNHSGYAGPYPQVVVLHRCGGISSHC